MATTFEKRSEKDVGFAREETMLSEDDAVLARLGYKAEFAREFSNLSTISFAFSIMGVASSVATTFDTPLLLAGPAAPVWCWFLGATMCCTIGASIAELVSAYPTSGGLYSASAYLVPKRYKAPVGWIVGWLNLLGQVAGVASTEFGLSRMIWAAVAISKPPTEELVDGVLTLVPFTPTNGELYGLYVGLLFVHGLINSLPTKWLAKITASFVFINLGSVLGVVIALGVCTDNKHSGSYVFGSLNNQSGWSSNALSFFLGLLSVQWTMTDYDATAHISEEVQRAAVAAPVAIFVAIVGTGLVGFIYNIVLVLCAGDLAELPGNSGLSVATIISNNVPLAGFYVLWTGICLTAFFVVTTALQANSRSFFAFSRDGGLPDRGLFGKMSSWKIPLWGVWLVVVLSMLLGLLQFASSVALNAVFSLCAIALDTSYAVPILCKIIFRDHPEVNYRPGPFDLGRGILAKAVNWAAVLWIAFVTVIFCLPTVRPTTALNMNYASVITVGVLFLSGVWYLLGGRKHYYGPRNFTGGASGGEQIRSSDSDSDDHK